MCMLVMIPIARPKGSSNGLATLESKLKDMNPADILRKMSLRLVQLTLPRFTIRSKTNVRDYLKKVSFVTLKIFKNLKRD